ncbi:MAG: sulfatase-like hydrolase/transferase, partial [Anaerolineales bacterium]
MNNRFSRRDFLKLAGLLPLGLSAARWSRMFDAHAVAQEKPRNVLVIIFDALSAYDISSYGYERQTTPNIDRLAKRAVVYHNHFA